ncbi:MAG: KamA family radical SAM protein [Spirochaetia bacterium]
MADSDDTENRQVKSREDIEKRLSLTFEEATFFEAAEEASRSGRAAPILPFAATSYYLDLAAGYEGIRRQCIPTVRELEVQFYEYADPLREHRFSPVPRLVHRYPDRALLLAADRCAVACRHCFRRYLTCGAGGDSGGGPGAEAGITPEELAAAERYLDGRPDIREVIVSGGDPLTLADERLFVVVRAAAGGAPRRTVRIASRMPVVLPRRITSDLAAELRAAGASWFVTQFNHPAELTPEARAATGRLIDAGIPVLNQAVLLKGVNDLAETLAELFNGLAAARVKPYYLFQGDLAAGTSHLRVNLEEGLEIVRELRAMVSGLAVPVYAVDLPEGGGKIPLHDRSIIGREGEWYILEGPRGDTYRYPVE